MLFFTISTPVSDKLWAEFEFKTPLLPVIVYAQVQTPDKLNPVFSWEDTISYSGEKSMGNFSVTAGYTYPYDPPGPNTIYLKILQLNGKLLPLQPIQDFIDKQIIQNYWRLVVMTIPIKFLDFMGQVECH